MCARIADMFAPTFKSKSKNKELSQPYIEQEIQTILEKFFAAGEQSSPAGKCPFCGSGDLVAMRLTDPQNENRGGVWCSRCNFRFMI